MQNEFFRLKRRTRQHIIADLSVNHVERSVLRCGYTAERTVYDYGTDLMLMTYDSNGEVKPGTVHLQLKATDSLPLLADQETIPFTLNRADIAHWIRQSAPNILVIYDVQNDAAYWLYVQSYSQSRSDFNAEQVGRTVTLRIPKRNVVNENAIQRFARFWMR